LQCVNKDPSNRIETKRKTLKSDRRRPSDTSHLYLQAVGVACDLRHVAAHEIDRFERALREKQQNRKSEGADSTRIYLCIYSHVCIYKCICIRTAINSCVRAFAGVAFIDAALFCVCWLSGKSSTWQQHLYSRLYIL